MTKFVENPLLPEFKVKHFITSADIEGAVKPFFTPFLDKGISHHGDLSICHLGKDRFVTSKGSFEYYKERLPGAKIIEGETEIKSPYPLDAAYCAAVFGSFAVANEKVTDRVLLSLLKEEFTFINVSQGYAKCNICPISEKAVITEDSGIYKALSCYMDVLLIEKGGILLPPYEYGFFGGSTGMIDKNTLFINGSLNNHPSGDKIYDFLEKYSVKTVERSGAIFDVGSVIPVGIL